MNSIVQTPTPRLPDSLQFYRRLHFTVLSEAGPTLVTDGRVVIEINPDRYARAGIKLYGDDWRETVRKLKEVTAVLPIDGGHLLSDPGGTWIYLMDGRPRAKADLSAVAPSLLGNYAGLSLEFVDLPRALALWQILGFSKTGGAAEQGWISLTRAAGGMTVSLMKANACPHLFFNPSLTYFNGAENLAVIGRIRTAGIPITEEITYFNKEGIVDNVVLRDPGGYGFFVFSD